MLHINGYFSLPQEERLFSSRAKTWSHDSFYYLGKILIKDLSIWLKAQYFKGECISNREQKEDLCKHPSLSLNSSYKHIKSIGCKQSELIQP